MLIYKLFIQIYLISFINYIYHLLLNHINIIHHLYNIIKQVNLILVIYNYKKILYSFFIKITKIFPNIIYIILLI
jgi:hypothetical protein